MLGRAKTCRIFAQILQGFFPHNEQHITHRLTMKHEIITLQDAQVIGMAKEIAFNNPSECSKFWGEYVERIVKPIYLEGKAPGTTSSEAFSFLPLP